MRILGPFVTLILVALLGCSHCGPGRLCQNRNDRQFSYRLLNRAELQIQSPCVGEGSLATCHNSGCVDCGAFGWQLGGPACGPACSSSCGEQVYLGSAEMLPVDPTLPSEQNIVMQPTSDSPVLGEYGDTLIESPIDEIAPGYDIDRSDASESGHTSGISQKTASDEMEFSPAVNAIENRRSMRRGSTGNQGIHEPEYERPSISPDATPDSPEISYSGISKPSEWLADAPEDSEEILFGGTKDFGGTRIINSTLGCQDETPESVVTHESNGSLNSGNNFPQISIFQSMPQEPLVESKTDNETVPARTESQLDDSQLAASSAIKAEEKTGGTDRLVYIEPKTYILVLPNGEQAPSGASDALANSRVAESPKVDVEPPATAQAERIEKPLVLQARAINYRRYAPANGLLTAEHQNPRNGRSIPAIQASSQRPVERWNVANDRGQFRPLPTQTNLPTARISEIQTHPIPVLSWNSMRDGRGNQQSVENPEDPQPPALRMRAVAYPQPPKRARAKIQSSDSPSTAIPSSQSQPIWIDVPPVQKLRAEPSLPAVKAETVFDFERANQTIRGLSVRPTSESGSRAKVIER